MHHMGLGNGPNLGPDSGDRPREDAADRPRQRSVRHRVQPGWRRPGHVRVRWRGRLGPHVRSEALGAFDHHLRGSVTPPAAAAGLEQAGPQLLDDHFYGLD